MTSELVASSVPRRRRLALLVIPVLVLLASSRLHPRTSLAVSPAPLPAPVCEAEPAPRGPGPDVWAALERCLRASPYDVTAEQVRRWVEVDHEPAWEILGAWELPLSDEGEPDFPSGMYVLLHPADPQCSYSLVN